MRLKEHGHVARLERRTIVGNQLESLTIHDEAIQVRVAAGDLGPQTSQVSDHIAGWGLSIIADVGLVREAQEQDP